MFPMIVCVLLPRFQLTAAAAAAGAAHQPRFVAADLYDYDDVARVMKSAFDAFVRHEERLQRLEMRPTEYVVRQMRFTPYPTEDVGWIIEQSGPDVCMFSSDYPHVEGGRRPIERFEASLGDAPADVRRRFYCDNFLDLMGRAGADLER